MNFYSEDIISNLDSPEKEQEFRDNSEKIIQRYLQRDIRSEYISNLFTDPKNKWVFYCMDFEYSIDNCPSVLVYHKYIDKKQNELKYYILLICTKHQFKKQGYASKLLDGFLERVKQENTHSEFSHIKIILSSIEESVLFYESYGFIWTTDTLLDHKILLKYEKYEKDKEYFILQLTL
jgi:GNAT superfamily N-acetyltransferase